MKIILAGGTGFIGQSLVKKLLEKGHEVTLLTHSAREDLRGHPKIVHWDPSPLPLSVRGGGREGALWMSELDGADAVINLAGETIAERWTKEKKEKIRRSRVETTRAIISAIGKTIEKPGLLINASAVGFYGDTKENQVDEMSANGTDFLAALCREWEEEAKKAEPLGVRVVLLRTGIVLGKGGGALKKMLPPFRFFLGGPLGSGNQWFPWIHLEDEIGAILFALENETISGPVNLTAPEPVRQKEFSKTLGAVMKRPSWLPVPGVALKLLLGEMSEMLLAGQRARPKKLTEAGFKFLYPEIELALQEIFSLS